MNEPRHSNLGFINVYANGQSFSFAPFPTILAQRLPLPQVGAQRVWRQYNDDWNMPQSKSPWQCCGIYAHTSISGR